MRTLMEIIEDLKDGNDPTYEEIYWALLAVDTLHHFDRQSLHRFWAGKVHASMVKLEADESFGRNKRAYQQDPKRWVGPANDPKNPERQRQRQIAKMLCEKMLAEAQKKRSKKAERTTHGNCL